MTGLQRSIKRSSLEYERGRPLCIELSEDGITIWPKRCRSQAVTIGIRAAYWYGARVKAGIEKQQRKLKGKR